MAALEGWSRFFEELSSFLVDIDRHSSTSSERYVEYVLERIPLCLRVIRQIAVVLLQSYNDSLIQDEKDIINYYTGELSDLFQTICAISNEWESQLDYIVSHRPNSRATSYTSPVLQLGIRGRPRFDIGESQLEYLSSLSFSWKQIASLLGVSRMTIYRRRVEFNMTEVGTFIHSYENLKAIVREMKRDTPYMGEVLLMGQLRANGYRVSRQRLRSAIREIDPINTALRLPAGLTARRPYHVPGPNSLWHIGGFYQG